MIYIKVKFRGKYKFNTSWRVSLLKGPKEWWVRENTPSSEDSGKEDGVVVVVVEGPTESQVVDPRADILGGFLACTAKVGRKVVGTPATI